MKPAQRHDWIMTYIKNDRSGYVDVLNRNFVDDYEIACRPKIVHVMPYGANKIPQLGRDLSALFEAGKLKRNAAGLTGMGGMGFPRWAYVYRLP